MAELLKQLSRIEILYFPAVTLVYICTKRLALGLSKGLFGRLTLGVIDPITKSLNRDDTIIKSTLVDEGVNVIKIRPPLLKSSAS